MKKITLTLLFAGSICLQSFSQSANNVNPATLGRTGSVAQNELNKPGSIVNGTHSKLYSADQALPKRGGIPSVAVAYSDDFSLPSDTIGLQARGYYTYYRGGGPVGTTACWFQGNATNWGDYNTGGTSAEYVSSNFNSVTGTNNIDNWLVLPALNIISGDVISFYSRSVSASTFADSIRVMYSASGDSTPEGLTWIELGRFKVNTANAWQQSTYSVTTAGATARFAIRYAVVDGGPQGNNSDLIGIDQIDVFTPAAFDVQSVSVSPLNTIYTVIPVTQSSGITISGDVKNNGLTATTGGTALFEVFDTLTAAVVFTETVNLPNLAPNATATLTTTNSFTPSAPGAVRSRITVSFPGDGNTANDIAVGTTTTYSDSIYARDNNVSTTSLGIGAGPADGIIGQNFQINTATTLTSVSFFIQDTFDPNPAGSPVYATIHNQTPGSAPDNAVLATSDSVIITPGLITPGGQWFTVQLDGASLPLSPGLYYVGLHEVDSLLTLGTTTQIVTPFSVWITWNTIPSPPAVNGWASVDDFGNPNFLITYLLRMNFGTPTALNEIEKNSNLFSVFPSPASSEVNIRLDRSLNNAKVEMFNSVGMLVKSMTNVNDLAKIDVSGYSAGIYTVMVTANGKSFTQRFSVSK